MTQEDDELTAKDIRRWYTEHGMPYLEEDWGERAETGESSGPQVQEGERTKEVRSTAATPDRMWWWEKQTFPWRARTLEEKEWALALESFFTPYVALLPRPKGNLLQQVFNDLRTYADVGEEAGIKRQSAHEAVERAVRDLTRLIASDDPLFRPPPDGRKRDYEEESRAARRVFVVFLRQHFAALRDELGE